MFFFDNDEDETSKPRAKRIMRIEVVHDIASMGATWEWGVIKCETTNWAGVKTQWLTVCDSDCILDQNFDHDL